MSKKKLSISNKMSIIISLMILISAVSVGTFGYVLYRNDCIKMGGEKAMAIAEAVAAGIDGDAMHQAMQDGEPGDAFGWEKKLADDTALSTNTAYLYILGAEVGNEVTYYMEGYNPLNDSIAELQFGDTEDASVFADEMYATLTTGESSYSNVFASGDFGNMVSGFAPIKNAAGQVVGVVGADIGINAVMASAGRFGTLSLIIMLGFSFIFGTLSIFIVNRLIGRPIKQLTEASKQIAVGDLDIALDIKSQDEIGQLATSFDDMANRTRHQVGLLEKLADGDLTITTQLRSPKDQMSAAVIKTADSLNRMFTEVRACAEQLTMASGQIADGAQVLAQGATEQNETVLSLQDEIGNVSENAAANVEMASRTTALVQNIKQNAETGSQQMQGMLQAVQQIDEASNAISTVMKAIDDIASQTNILALNAAVEAARAGEHGKGFAVVADEVRNLAAKSAASAKETSTMIEDSLEKAALGVQIATETSATFAEIVTGINKSEEMITGIGSASESQSTAANVISSCIDVVSQVVQQNSATAEESAAASEELNGQAQQLLGILDHFKVREEAPALSAPEVKQLTA